MASSLTGADYHRSFQNTTNMQSRHSSNSSGDGGGISNSSAPLKIMPHPEFYGDHMMNPENQQKVGEREEDWKLVIKYKQQRLLLLHHSAKCTVGEGRRTGDAGKVDNYVCSVSPYCAQMKRLWQHMKRCQDTDCQIKHCFSSRAILNHYRKCKDEICPVCSPVRNAVRQTQLQEQEQQQQLKTNQVTHTSVKTVSPDQEYMTMPPSSASSQPFSEENHYDPYYGNTGIHNNNPSSSLTMCYPTDLTNSFVAPAGNYQSYPVVSPSTMVPPFCPNNTAPSPSTFYQQQEEKIQPPLSTASSFGANNNRSNSSSSSSCSTGSEQRLKVPTQMTNQNRNNIDSGRDDDSAFDSPYQSQQDIIRKQQRLLLIRHASECKYKDGECKVTRHCTRMKQLYKHISHCNEKDQCSVKHCISCRHVLSHYKQCMDNSCQICEPVRKLIHKSESKMEERKKRKSNNNSPASQTIASAAQQQQHPSLKKLKLGKQQSLTTMMAQSFAHNNKITSKSFDDNKKTMRLPASAFKSSSIMNKDANQQQGERYSSSSLDVNNNNIKQEKKVFRPALKEDDHQSAVVNNPPGAVATTITMTAQEHQHQQQHQHQKTKEEEGQGYLSLAMKQKCLEILNGLQTHEYGWVFNTPVDPVLLCVPDYFDIIKKPMDLGTINTKLMNGLCYHTIEDFKDDVHLTFDNSITYNGEGSAVCKMAQELKAKFDSDCKQTF